MTVLVSLPYFNTPHLVRRAVDSILGQTFKDLRVVVLNDGKFPPWNQLADIKDERLVRFELSKNRGRYFADAVSLAANPYEFFTVHDSDDWSESTRYQVLAEAINEADVACDNWTRHGMNDGVELHKSKPVLIGHHSSRSLWHIAHHKGLWRTEALRTIGMHPGFRMGWDTYLMHFAALTLKIEWVNYFGYHQQRRANSLVTSKTTGVASKSRAEAIVAMEEMWKRAQAEPERVTEICAPTPEVKALVEGEAERLRGLL